MSSWELLVNASGNELMAKAWGMARDVGMARVQGMARAEARGMDRARGKARAKAMTRERAMARGCQGPEDWPGPGLLLRVLLLLPLLRLCLVRMDLFFGCFKGNHRMAVRVWRIRATFAQSLFEQCLITPLSMIFTLL